MYLTCKEVNVRGLERKCVARGLWNLGLFPKIASTNQSRGFGLSGLMALLPRFSAFDEIAKVLHFAKVFS